MAGDAPVKVTLTIEGEAAELAPVLQALALQASAAAVREELSREESAPLLAERLAGAEVGDNAGTRTPAMIEELPAEGTSAAALDAGSSPPSDGDPTGSGEVRLAPPPGPAAAVPYLKRGNGRRICPMCNRGWSSREHRAHTHIAIEPEGYEPPNLKAVEESTPVDARRASLIAQGLICAVEGCGGRLFRDDDGPYCLAGHRPREAVPPEITLPAEPGRRQREPSHAGAML